MSGGCLNHPEETNLKSRQLIQIMPLSMVSESCNHCGRYSENILNYNSEKISRGGYAACFTALGALLIFSCTKHVNDTVHVGRL